MKLQMYSLYDETLKAFNIPNPARNDADAIRQCQNILEKGTGNIAKYPNQFTLFHLYTWDDETLEITRVNDNIISPRLVINLGSLQDQIKKETK